MDWTIAVAILFGVLFAGLLSGLPVAFVFMAINIAGLFLLLGGSTGLELLAGSAFGAVANFALIPIPLFILMGELLMRSGVAGITIDAVDQWVGRVPGRLSLVAVGGSVMWGALSGSSMATTAVFGSTMMPEMERRGYKPQMSVAPILAAGGLDVLIPPSALGVLLGALAKISIAGLLIGAIIPGLLLAFVYGLYFVGRAALQPHLAPPYAAPPVPLPVRLRVLLHLIPLAGLVAVVTGLIFFGVATPSEAAALGAVASALLALAYGKLNWQVLRKSLLATVSITSMVFLILVGSSAYSQLMAISGAAAGFVGFVTGLALSPLAMVIGMQLVIFTLGCFIDAISIMMITLPVFMPVVIAMKIDPIWFAVLFLINLELAGITPPFGVQLFVMKGVRPQLSMVQIYVAALPIVVLQLFVIGLVMAFPGLTSWLPGLMLSP